MKTFKLGKTKARPEAVTFKLKNFIDKSVLPKPPKTFGHEKFIDTYDWQMFANDEVGDCVLAGAAHETMLWNAEAGKTVNFTDKGVLSDYSAITGYDPNDPNTDQGTDMSAAASYRRKTGVVDADGVRHKIVAYLAIEPGNLTELYQALYLFGAVGVGIEFPASAMDQINAGKAWSVVSRSPLEGGHYIAMVAKRTRLECVTWGQIQPLTTGFYRKYNDESIAMISEEMLINRKSPEGFDYDGLVKCLNALK